MLGTLGPHHARGGDQEQAREIPAIWLSIQHPQNRFGECISDDGQGANLLTLNGVEEFFDV